MNAEARNPRLRALTFTSVLNQKRGTMKSVRLPKLACVAAILCVATAVASQAQNLTTLGNFNGFNGGDPANTNLIQGTDGNLYGATQGNGVPHTKGTIFRITPAGKLTTLYRFCSQPKCSDGWVPTGVVQGNNGSLYGIAEVGGVTPYCTIGPGCGTLFKLSPQGKYTVLYSFCSETNCSDGDSPGLTLVQANNGNFYGTTFCGGLGLKGANCNGGGSGTLFQITPAGKLTTLYSFCSETNCADGGEPTTGLVIGPNGSLYGTTSLGGTSSVGTLFQFSAAGKFTVLHNFTTGEEGLITLMLAGDGSLYGTTSSGDNSGGRIFRLASGGDFTTIYSFCSLAGCADGSSPQEPLVQGSDGNLYGTASSGGATGNGTIFKITPEGKLTTLYNFCLNSDCPDGREPDSLMQATNGSFYGMTQFGGSTLYGTVFKFSTGLGPFVAESPTFGKVSQVVRILGNNLTGTTSVTFNSMPAAFKVVSSTFIEATLPSGATTGTIEVTTPSGTLKSNVAFQVIQ
jgi:uncharacterized repeat protein (TIGR03803 family)